MAERQWPGENAGGPANSSSRLVHIPVEPDVAGVGLAAPPGPRSPDLAGLATFTLDAQGRVATWTVAAARLFGRTARAIVGQDVSEALMPGTGHAQLLRQALGEARAGRVWTATLSMALAGGGTVALRCEPMAEPGAGALMIAQRVPRSAGQVLLSEAATRIGTTLDLTQTAREAVDLTVPGFADAAGIVVPERMLAADEFAPHEPGRPVVLRRLVTCLAGYPAADTDRLLAPGEVLVFGEDCAIARAMESGRPVLHRHLDDATLQRLSASPAGQAIAAGFGWFLAVPLIARGLVVGCVIFARAAAGPKFRRADIELAGQLAARAALCIDNARMYNRERRIATALQRGLLPGRPAVPPGLEVAHRYLPVGANVVGGDWHDIVTLPGGKAAVIVGDAMGHGPEAAAVMVQLRTAAHTLADLDLPPEEVLRRLDRLAAGMTVTAFATCICAVIDPADGSCVIAKAGHLPPVMVEANGATRVLDLPAGLPLGLGVESFEATPVSLPPGATLALYTDGLVESRYLSVDAGTAAMREALGRSLAEPGAALAGPCHLVTESLRRHGEDDITLVLARIRG
jgi:serine phosphatase RsbU (regulator of sigma subunit)